jgi:hypothetical protein
VEERQRVKEHLESMSAREEAAQRTQLSLSAVALFIKADGRRATHNVHLIDPGWVAERIRWVFDGSTSTM